MGVFIGAKEWKDIIERLEMHDRGLADTLALTADPELQHIFKAGESDLKSGSLLPFGEV